MVQSNTRPSIKYITSYQMRQLTNIGFTTKPEETTKVVECLLATTTSRLRRMHADCVNDNKSYKGNF